jgi:uncharacterized protein DUF5657
MISFFSIPLLQATIYNLDNSHTLDNLLQTLFKSFFIIDGIFYVILSVIIIRQINIMRKTLITPFSPVIEMLGFVHLIISVLVLTFFIVVL